VTEACSARRASTGAALWIAFDPIQGRALCARVPRKPASTCSVPWVGATGVPQGADSVDPRTGAKSRSYKAESVVDFTPEDNYFEQISKRLGASAAESAARAVLEFAARGQGELR
jgi:hypothetical protein